MVRRKLQVLPIGSQSQMRAVSTPVRIRIFEELARADGELSIRQIARKMGRPPASLYRHMEILRRSGLVRLAGIRGKGRTAEKIYVAAARSLKSVPPTTVSQRRAFARLGKAHIRYATRCFSESVESGVARFKTLARNAVVLHLILNVAPRDLVVLNRDLDAFVQRWQRRAAQGTPSLSLAFVMGPLERR